MSRKSDADNHANQMNPNNDAYWSSRGEERPSERDDEPTTTAQVPAPHASGGDRK